MWVASTAKLNGGGSNKSHLPIHLSRQQCYNWPPGCSVSLGQEGERLNSPEDGAGQTRLRIPSDDNREFMQVLTVPGRAICILRVVPSVPTQVHYWNIHRACVVSPLLNKTTSPGWSHASFQSFLCLPMESCTGYSLFPLMISTWSLWDKNCHLPRPQCMKWGIKTNIHIHKQTNRWTNNKLTHWYSE